MSKQNKATPDNNPSTDQLDDELRALISDAAPASNDEAIVAELPAATAEAEVDLEALDAEAAAETIKSEAYAEQAADESDGTATVTPITAAKPRTPRVSRAAGAKAFDVLKGAMNDDQMLKVAMLSSGDAEDVSLVDSLRDTVNGLAKKVGDKATNLLRHAGDPKKVQKFTGIGLAHLIEHGSTSSTLLTKEFQDQGYTIGTARSQANQLMALLPALKVADKSGRNLTLRADSNIVSAYKGATATA
jgi:hypothetical protein